MTFRMRQVPINLNQNRLQLTNVPANYVKAVRCSLSSTRSNLPRARTMSSEPLRPFPFALLTLALEPTLFPTYRDILRHRSRALRIPARHCSLNDVIF